jgi:hypothetical protein
VEVIGRVAHPVCQGPIGTIDPAVRTNREVPAGRVTVEVFEIAVGGVIIVHSEEISDGGDDFVGRAQVRAMADRF